MKTRILLFIGILLLSYGILDSKEVTISNNPSPEGSLNVYTSTELYNLTMKWVGEYGALNPKLKINVIKSADDNIAGMLKRGNGIGFVANQSFVSPDNHSWNMVVGRDVIVPVMNAANPFRDEIKRKGITPEGLAKILQNKETPSWEMLVGNTKNMPDMPVHFYIMNDPSTLAGVENFLKTNEMIIKGSKTASGKEMISAIQQDPNALGFCKLIQIMDLNNQSLAENIKLVPIDKNGSGKIDYMENIYDNLQAFSRGVWIGKYPKALASRIYSVSSEKPKNETELAFLNWVLNEGQQFLNENGYNDLVLSERKTQLDIINAPPVVNPVVPRNEIRILLTMILMVLFAFVIIGIIMDFIVRFIKNKKGTATSVTSGSMPVFDEDSVIIPRGLYFDKTHTWAFMKKDGTVKIGIDDFLQHVTGHLTRIEMKNSGEKIKKGDHLFTIIQKGKKLNIYSPISGTIASYNGNLINDSSLLNDSPYDDGWIYTIEPTNWLLEIQFLTMNEKYKAWLKDEFSRLKDFFASVVKFHTPEYALNILQDGGSLRDSILSDLGPAVWDDFQTKFIDIAK